MAGGPIDREAAEVAEHALSEQHAVVRAAIVGDNVADGAVADLHAADNELAPGVVLPAGKKEVDGPVDSSFALGDQLVGEGWRDGHGVAAAVDQHRDRGRPHGHVDGLRVRGAG